MTHLKKIVEKKKYPPEKGLNIFVGIICLQRSSIFTASFAVILL